MKKKEVNEVEKKKILGEGMALGIEYTMRNHVYEFDGELYRQKEGGAIGLLLTCIVAELFMARWMKRFRVALEVRKHDLRAEVELLISYVDDVNIQMEVRMSDGEERRACEERVVREVKEIANGIEPCINMKEDTTWKHENGLVMLPIIV